MRRQIGQALTFVLLLSLAGCGGEMGMENGTGTPGGPGSGTNQQCPPEKMICVGDADTGALTCTCNDLWDCSKNPVKCTQATPTPEGAAPPGGNGWECTWTEQVYTCKVKSTDKTNPPGVPPGSPPGTPPTGIPPGGTPPGGTVPGGSGWTCKYDETFGGWQCTEKPPVPNGSSKWTCVVSGGQLSCSEVPGQPPAPSGNNQWSCAKDASGKMVCTTGDLPPGGSNWTCSQFTKSGVPTWVCVGPPDTPNNPPGGNGWSCVPLQGEFNQWKCEKPVDTPPTAPPGGGTYQCVKGTEWNGTKCEEVPPKPPGSSSNVCLIGQKMWCDGLQYCGWGQVDCDPATGKWRTRSYNGKEILDCQELADGRRPNTKCACYFFYFNPSCCERPDCLVPVGANGQICGPSGGGLCDYCNPQKSECKNNGRCIVTNNHETFCGQPCSVTQPCPADYNCMTTKTTTGINNQCVPVDFSCFF